ncbi:MAG: SDR family NAD(P)-dependent oxidoreductase, partial [Chloroflexi bacterium]|nr:SDR family NAD(P)-dependent oxidoreductase [Chloroflexota bacterium]
MMESLDGKIALVTGGGTGIGRAAAIALADRGATVIVAGRRQEPLDEVVTLIGDSASAITADLADPDDTERLAREVLAQHG